MELKKGDIINTTNKDILKKYSLVVNSAYKEYSYLDLSYSDFSNMVMNAIELSKQEYNDETSYSNYLRKSIDETLISYMNNLCQDDTTALKIINSFIDKNFIGSQSNDYIIFYLTKLDEFFANLDYIPNPDVIIKIVAKNTRLQNVIKTYIGNRLYHTKKFADNVMNKNIVCSIIDAYCGMYEVKDTWYEMNKNLDEAKDYMQVDSLKQYFDEIKNIPPLTVKEEEKYGYEALKGSNEAKEILIKHNLKLVVSVAKRYVGLGVPMSDLIQDGNEGLIIAANRYDVRQGCRFSTYGAMWIRNSIYRSLAENGKIFKIEVSYYTKIVKYQTMFNKLAIQLNRIPTDKEMAEHLNLSIKEIKKISSLTMNHISLNDYIGSDNDKELSEIIDLTDSDMENEVMLSVLPKEIEKLLSNCNLSDKERKTLIYRYGLDGSEPKTLQAVGDLLGNISRERVRRLESLALKKIRTSAYIKEFAIYLDNPSRAIKLIDECCREYESSVLNGYTLKPADSQNKGKIKTYNTVRNTNVKRK